METLLLCAVAASAQHSYVNSCNGYEDRSYGEMYPGENLDYCCGFDDDATAFQYTVRHAGQLCSYRTQLRMGLPSSPHDCYDSEIYWNTTYRSYDSYSCQHASQCHLHEESLIIPSAGVRNGATMHYIDPTAWSLWRITSYQWKSWRKILSYLILSYLTGCINPILSHFCLFY